MPSGWSFEKQGNYIVATDPKGNIVKLDKPTTQEKVLRMWIPALIAIVLIAMGFYWIFT